MIYTQKAGRVPHSIDVGLKISWEATNPPSREVSADSYIGSRKFEPFAELNLDFWPFPLFLPTTVCTFGAL